MKKTVILTAVLFLLSCASSRADTFNEANGKYQAGDFKAAAQGYESLAAAGHGTAPVYFDLGNADFRLDRKGPARAAYERALALKPRDADIRWNLNLLKKSTLADLEDTPGNIFLYKLNEALDACTPNELAAALLLSLALMALFALWRFFSPEGRALLSVPRALSVIFFILAALLFTFKAWDGRDRRAVVLDKEVFARFGPSEKETKAFLLHEGAKVRVADENDDWLYVSLDKQRSGWLPKKSCEIL